MKKKLRTLTTKSGTFLWRFDHGFEKVEGSSEYRCHNSVHIFSTVSSNCKARVDIETWADVIEGSPLNVGVSFGLKDGSRINLNQPRYIASLIDYVVGLGWLDTEKNSLFECRLLPAELVDIVLCE